MFINITTFTKDVIKESNFLLLRSKKIALLLRILLILFLISILTFLISDILKTISDNYILYTAAVPILLFFIIALLLIYYYKIKEQRLRVLYGGKDIEVSYEFSNQIVMYDLLKDAKYYFEYGQIVKVIESKNLFVLVIVSDIYLKIDKKGFTHGSWEEFKEFIFQKRRDSKQLVK